MVCQWLTDSPKLWADATPSLCIAIENRSEILVAIGWYRWTKVSLSVGSNPLEPGTARSYYQFRRTLEHYTTTDAGRRADDRLLYLDRILFVPVQR